jgi:hypothetical protein
VAGLSIPIPNLTLAMPGGAAAPSEASSGADSGGDTGAVMFSDGAFQVGGSANSAPTEETQTAPTNPYDAQSAGNALPQGMSTTTSSSSLLPLLLIGGALCYVFLLHK